MTDNKTIMVLLVDDEERFLLTTAAALRKRGLKVASASNGSDAVLKVWRGDFDVVVLDLKMPGMNGHQTLREIKGLKPDIKIIMLTGHGSLESALEGWQDGVTTYLLKPCDIEVLADTIRHACGNGGQGRAEAKTKPSPM